MNWIIAAFRFVRTLRLRRHNALVAAQMLSYSDGIADGACMALTGKPLRRDS